MKKLVLLAAIALGAITANAQAIKSPAFGENWSVGLDAGATTPLHHAAFWGDMRGLFGVNVKKQITPAFGLGVESQLGVNTSSWRGRIHSSTGFDDVYVGAYGTVDLRYLFSKYKCENHVFGVEVLGGLGWSHYMFPSGTIGPDGVEYDQNFLATKVGVNFNFNVSEHFTIAIKPSVSWNLNGKAHRQLPDSYDVNFSQFNIQAGLVWHLSGNSFDCVEPFDQATLDNLNAQINELRAAIEASLLNNAAWEAKAGQLAEELAACMSRKPEVIVKDDNTLTSVRYVFYKIGSSVITADQMPNVEMIADYLKNHKDAKVDVKGYASQDGPLELNIKLAQARAESVKNALVNKYGISASRISAEGQGIGHMFKEDSWNRVSICMIEE